MQNGPGNELQPISVSAPARDIGTITEEAVRNVIRGITLLLVALDKEGSTGSYIGYGTETEVVYEGDTLGRHADGALGEHDVVIDKGRAMGYLDEDILVGHHAAGLGT